MLKRKAIKELQPYEIFCIPEYDWDEKEGALTQIGYQIYVALGRNNFLIYKSNKKEWITRDGNFTLLSLNIKLHYNREIIPVIELGTKYLWEVCKYIEENHEDIIKIFEDAVKIKNGRKNLKPYIPIKNERDVEKLIDKLKIFLNLLFITPTSLKIKKGNPIKIEGIGLLFGKEIKLVLLLGRRHIILQINQHQFKLPRSNYFTSRYEKIRFTGGVFKLQNIVRTLLQDL